MKPMTVTELRCNGIGVLFHQSGYALTKTGQTRVFALLPFPHFPTRSVYSVTLDPVTPLTMAFGTGWTCQPNRSVKDCDFLSIPPDAELLSGISHDRYLLTALFHDSGYHDGGLFWAPPGSSEYVFRPMTREAVDDFLVLGVRAEGGDESDGRLMRRFVRWFGGSTWHGQRTRDLVRGRVGHREKAGLQ